VCGFKTQTIWAREGEKKRMSTAFLDRVMREEPEEET
jgi:hypothetical protein